MSELSPPEAPAPPAEIRAQLDRILNSQTLAASDQLKRLLQSVVERTLAVQPERLKEYTLGLEVFHRPPDYDPKVDPIVRVQARRLRSKLDEYYAQEGARDPYVIEIPRGAYVPVFRAQIAEPRPEGKPASPERSARRRGWIAAGAVSMLALLLALAWKQPNAEPPAAEIDRSVAVLPLQMFSEGGSRGYIADQAAEVLTTELAKSRQLRVLSRTTASRYRDQKMSLPEIAQALRVRWVVEGGVGTEGARAYIKLRAVDARTDRKVWADVFDCDVSQLVAVNIRAADTIAAAIARELQSSQP